MILPAVVFINSYGRELYGRTVSQHPLLEKEMPAVACEPGRLWERCALQCPVVVDKEGGDS